MQSNRILASLVALLFCTTTVRADAVYPSVNSTASWSYSSPEGSHHGSISSGATQRSHNWGNEAAFNITSPPPPGQYFPLMADFVYGQRAHPYLLTPPSQAHTGQYVAFDSLISSEWSDDPSRIFQWKISGTFNAQSENGQHYLFQSAAACRVRAQLSSWQFDGDHIQRRQYASETGYIQSWSRCSRNWLGSPDLGFNLGPRWPNLGIDLYHNRSNRSLWNPGWYRHIYASK